MFPTIPARDGTHDLDGTSFHVIADLDCLDPFLMNLVCAGDPWLFASSHGGATVGRRNADHALLPYYTEDKLADVAHGTGAFTHVRLDGAAWEPLAARWDRRHDRWLAKSALGDEIVWAERRNDLVFATSWRLSPRYGWVRQCRLANEGDAPVSVRIVDGVRNVLPAGATEVVQNRLSVLLDAYKRNELDPTGLGIYSLSSQLTDLAEPSEALAASIVWRHGPTPQAQSVRDADADAVRRGDALTAATDTRGVRGAHLSSWTATVAPGESTAWATIGDVELDTAAVANLQQRLADPAACFADVEADLALARDTLIALLADADAFQRTGDAAADDHHLASVLYNAMRGGIPLDGYRVQGIHIAQHLRDHNTAVADLWGDAAAALGDTTWAQLQRWAEDTGDADLIRLASTYLPLTFGRRHGDPSRPWNKFDIVVADADGRPATGFQGNWRDLFQNWEGLARSYPGFLPGFVSVFCNATTIDGYNPYRVTHRGIDWESPDPDDPWANIGYWGDHQLIYLLRLLDLWSSADPDGLAALWDAQRFAVADLPYRIAGAAAIEADPWNTIAFDAEADARMREVSLTDGADARLRHRADGEVFRVTLADKLLTLLAVKAGNLVPDGGIWMNTQRPEWNDANNALAGLGLSVVTTAHAVAFVDFLVAGLAGRDVAVRAPLAAFLADLAAVFADDPIGLDDAARLQVLRRLGQAGEAYREAAYAADEDATVTLPAADVAAFLAGARRWLDACLAANRRDDDLVHSYNVLDLGEDRASIRHLDLMLEGQVAALGSASSTQAAQLAAALPTTDLFCPRRGTYLLYPDRGVPGFLERNRIPAGAIPAEVTERLLALSGQPVIRRDDAGDLRWAPGLRNARELRERLADDPDAPLIEDAYERTFHHDSFTGRSGSFFAYEGLGSVYWHMVSKLALAVLERARGAQDPSTAEVLAESYRGIRAGLGFEQTATAFGAFPADPYSHTPAHRGASQPGMTGQVKEDICIRFAELGVRWDAGDIHFDRDFVHASQWLTGPARLRATDGASVDLVAGELAFSLCGVPVVYGCGDPDLIVVDLADGGTRESRGSLGSDLSAHVFQRDGWVRRIRVGA